MIPAEEVTKMLVEIMTGKPPSLEGDEAAALREQIKRECDEIVAAGGMVDVPAEIPDFD